MQMKLITFDDIHNHGRIIEENEIYKHYQYEEFLQRYDSNFIEFKKMPSFSKFLEVKDFLKKFHTERNQKHLRFKFPANMKLTSEIEAYLRQEGYEIGFLELYAIEPSQFPAVGKNLLIDVQAVNEENFEAYLLKEYNHDVTLGVEYAKQKAEHHKRCFKDPSIMQVAGFFEGELVASVIVHVEESTVEIDDLVVNESYQKRGIGFRLQRFVMDTFPEKTIILVADGEDTPRDMYQKQGYRYLGFMYHAQKVEE
jgi:GNAT superfamily N-acetyltransferase